MSVRGGLDPAAALTAANYLQRPAEEYGNDAHVEALWAVRCHDYSQVHYSLICSAEPKLLKLTKYDEGIYTKFRETFPNFKLDEIDIDELKSEDAKEKWRIFLEEMKGLEDFSYGTLVRLNANGVYSESNTILVARAQFLAIEIARNREGYNDAVYEQSLKENQKEKPSRS